MKEIKINVLETGKIVTGSTNMIQGELNYIQLNINVDSNYLNFNKYLDFEWFDTTANSLESVRSPLIANNTLTTFSYILPQFYAERVKMQFVFVSVDSLTETYSNQFEMYFKDIIDAVSGVIATKQDILNDFEQRIQAIEAEQGNIDFLLGKYDEDTETLQLDKLELRDLTNDGYASIYFADGYFTAINASGQLIFSINENEIAFANPIPNKKSQKFTPTGGNKYFTVTDFTLTEYQLIHNDSLQGSNSEAAGQIIYYAGAVDGEEITIMNLG
jgi:hypothetical protein